MAEIQHIKLSELTQKIEAVIKNSFGNDFYWIIAEISSHKFYPNQDRHYFKFIEKTESSSEPIAKVDAVSWQDGSLNIKVFEQRTGQKFTNGILVLVKVKVEFHSAFGFKLILRDIDHNFTIGVLEQQRRETLSKLVLENPSFITKVGEEFVTNNKKLKFNAVIQRIALIGSPNSEGYTDFIHTIRNNQFGYKFGVDTYYSSVQGAESEKEMVNSLISIFNSGIKYDCVVFIRGGGAKTDFLVFDSYSLSRTVAKFPIPVITGIGHHMDVSIVDLMSHTSTKTPTKAAEFIVSHNQQFEEKIILLQKAVIIKSQGLMGKLLQSIGAINLTIINKSRLILGLRKDALTSNQQIVINKTKTLLFNHGNRLTSYNQIVINKTKTIIYNNSTKLVALLNNLLSKPKSITSNKSNDLSNLISNLKIFSSKYLVNQRGYLGHYESVIRLMSPKSILKRGFAIVSKKGKVVRNADGISVGESISITLAETIIESKVLSKTINDGN